nr:MAG: major capsid protein [Microviridae sp.]
MICPFYCDCTIMPGDTIKMNTANVVRMMTPIAPVMDNANMDTYFFFVPYRLIWEHFREFMGENDTAPWKQTTEYEIPQIVAPENGWLKGSLADYLGYPTKVGGYKASALPFRAYALIWNEWFRDQNLKNPCYISMGDGDINGIDKTTAGANYDYVTDTEKGAAPCKVAKYHDYFTSCLPEPQKGPSVTVPIGTWAPVYAKPEHIDPSKLSEHVTALAFSKIGPNNTLSTPSTGTLGIEGPTGIQAATIANTTPPPGYSQYLTPSNLYTDLQAATGATINQLRQAFAIQRFYEKQALYGTRYIEMIKGHFHVTNPDFRMQRPEYLGGMQTPINMNQVIQTDASRQSSYYDTTENAWVTPDTTPQGNAAAFSLTSGREKDLFTHSFTEHGILMGLCCVRTVHTYQQGLNAQYSKKKFTDFYFPEFANLGNTAVYNKEIYLQNTSADNEIFGYQEAWADYRYKPNYVTGEMRSAASTSLDVWHLADDYSSTPYLSASWIREDKSNVNRVIAVSDQLANQLFGDFYFKCKATRAMPMYSIPGLIDHH